MKRHVCHTVVYDNSDGNVKEKKKVMISDDEVQFTHTTLFDLTAYFGS